VPFGLACPPLRLIMTRHSTVTISGKSFATTSTLRHRILRLDGIRFH
jgi:hypothetical protein